MIESLAADAVLHLVASTSKKRVISSSTSVVDICFKPLVVDIDPYRQEEVSVHHLVEDIMLTTHPNTTSYNLEPILTDHFYHIFLS